jgi:hypothetical protein
MGNTLRSCKGKEGGGSRWAGTAKQEVSANTAQLLHSQHDGEHAAVLQEGKCGSRWDSAAQQRSGGSLQLVPATADDISRIRFEVPLQAHQHAWN